MPDSNQLLDLGRELIQDPKMRDELCRSAAAQAAVVKAVRATRGTRTGSA